MAQEIIDAASFSVDNLSITPQKPMTGGGKMAFMNYKRKGLYIQLPPPLSCPRVSRALPMRRPVRSSIAFNSTSATTTRTVR